MATQGWLAPDWESTDWVVDNWLAAFVGASPATAQLVGQQARNFAGASDGPWVSYDWVSADWVAGEWRAGGSWRAVGLGAITGLTLDWSIPQVELAPVWTFRMQAGVDARIVGVQAPNIGLLTAQFITVANDRAGQIVSQQDPNTAVWQAQFTPSISLRTAQLVGQQAAQFADITATHIVSGGIPNKRYGRK